MEEQHLYQSKPLDMVDLDDFMDDFMDSNFLTSMTVYYISEKGVRTKIEKSRVS